MITDSEMEALLFRTYPRGDLATKLVTERYTRFGKAAYTEWRTTPSGGPFLFVVDLIQTPVRLKGYRPQGDYKGWRYRWTVDFLGTQWVTPIVLQWWPTDFRDEESGKQLI